MTNATVDDELFDHAVVCAMRHQWGYRGYETIDKASTAFRRRVRGIKKSDREKLLQQAMIVNDEAMRRAKKLATANPKLSPEELMNSDEWNHEIESLMNHYPLFPVTAVNSALRWGYFWGVLR